MRRDFFGPRQWFGGKRVDPSPALSPVVSPSPATLGRYRLERSIGRGAMGAVYLGFDAATGRQVAVKTLALAREFEGDALDEARSRFFREAETAGRLSHPDIVEIFEAGEEGGLAYIAMEHVPGRDLLRHASPDALLPQAAVVAIAIRVAEALACAHRYGVVHRDVKPANVMVDPASDTVKVTDFGIARVSDGRRTRTGLLLGTPSFMSPEQLTGQPVDGRTDVYALGVMLFQLLGGVLPHQSDSMATLMAQIVNATAPDIRSIRPDVPAALAAVVARALEKRAAQRYADGERMAADLRAVAAGLDAQGLRTMLAAPGVSPSGVESSHPQASVFETTLKISRPVPRHNSGS